MNARHSGRTWPLLGGLAAAALLGTLLVWLSRDEGTRSAGRAPPPSAGDAAATAAPPSEPLAVAAAAADAPRTDEPGARASLGPGAAPTPADGFAPDAVTGRVLAGGAPVADAEVFLLEGGLRGDDERTPASAVTDSDGRFRFPGLVAHRAYTLVAQHPDFLPEREGVHAGRTCTVELERAAPVAGTVVAAASGSPLEGIEVAVRAQHFGPDGLRRYETSTTDAEGRWRLRWASAGIGQFLVTAPGRLGETHEFQVAEGGGSGFEIVLGERDGLELELYALESGTVLADTEVLTFERPARTDARGRLRVPTDAQGRTAVSLALPGGCVTRGNLEASGPGNYLRVPLVAGGRARGRVLDADGSPVAGALVRPSGGGSTPEDPLARALPPGFYLRSGGARVESGEDGSFELTGLVPGNRSLYLRASHPEHPGGRSASFELTRSGEEVEVDVVLEAGATVTGTVLVEGEPAPARVYALGERVEQWTRPDDRGGYSLAGLPSGEVWLRARLEGEDEDVPRPEDRLLVLEDGSALRVDFELEPRGARITGRVVDVHGEPVEGARVRARLRGEDELLEEDLHGEGDRTHTDAEGFFELTVSDVPGLAFGVSAQEGPRVAFADEVRAGAELELVLPELAELELRVLDARLRAPVGGFQLYWRPGDEGRYEGLSQGGSRLSPGPDGTFLAYLPAGRLDLAVAASEPGYLVAFHDSVRLRPASRTHLDVLLEPGLTLLVELVDGEGSVKVADAQRLLRRAHSWIAAEDQLALRERGGSWFQNEVRRAQSLRPEEGVARLEGLAPGHYRLQQAPSGYRFRPAAFDLPPVDEHRVQVRLERVPARKKRSAK